MFSNFLNYKWYILIVNVQLLALAHKSNRYRTVVNSEYTHINCVDIGLTGQHRALYS